MHLALGMRVLDRSWRDDMPNQIVGTDRLARPATPRRIVPKANDVGAVRNISKVLHKTVPYFMVAAKTRQDRLDASQESVDQG